MNHRTRIVIFANILVGLAIPGCGGDNADLTSAINAGIGRGISEPPASLSLRWTQVTPSNATHGKFRPVGLCWLGDRLLVADDGTHSIYAFSSSGVEEDRWGDSGATSGDFIKLSALACAENGDQFLVADAGANRINYIDRTGTVLRQVPAPPTPQKINVLGTFALGSGGQWYDSWLGARASIGPYLSEKEWEGIPLARRWTTNREAPAKIGHPRAYGNTVARRVFNRTSLALTGDTLWVLTQADATVRGFAPERVDSPFVINLPIYFRGREPRIRVDDPLEPGESFRPSKLFYDPNIQGLTVVGDTLFATIRFHHWHYTLEGTGLPSLHRRASSTVEVVNRAGSVLRAWAIPEMAVDIAADGRRNIAVITVDESGDAHMYVTALPLFRSRTGPMTAYRDE